jgi:hypothetical protein
MRVRLTKLGGDDNKGDYIPNGYWVLGEVSYYPTKGFTCFMGMISRNSEGGILHCNKSCFETGKVEKVKKMDWGFLIEAKQQLWKYEEAK